jgi:hypothetical protein
MAKQTLEQRFAVLEAQVDKLQEEIEATRTHQPKDWKRAIEKYGGDADLQAIFSAAMKLRQADRNRARQRPRKRATKE